MTTPHNGTSPGITPGTNPSSNPGTNPGQQQPMRIGDPERTRAIDYLSDRFGNGYFSPRGIRRAHRPSHQGHPAIRARCAARRPTIANRCRISRIGIGPRYGNEWAQRAGGVGQSLRR
ncbi:DUF1707 domain-containing protein [Corynebacterium urogenitale]